MNSTITEDNTDAFKREPTTLTSDGPAAAVPSWIKPSSSRKSRILSHRPSIGKSGAHDFQISRTMTATNRPTSKLPSVLSTPHHQSVTADSTRFQHETHLSKHPPPSSPPKFDRQYAAINASTRLPTLYSLFSVDDEKRISILRRRQIYALNHLMRELEQDQFRQYCHLNGIGSGNGQSSIGSDSQPSSQSSV